MGDFKKKEGRRVIKNKRNRRNRKKNKIPVYIIIYKLRKRGSALGLYHSGVILDNVEFCYTNQTGVFTTKPGAGRCVGMQLKKIFKVGYANIDMHQLRDRIF